MAKTPKKPRLSAREKRLLEYPPTPETWICPSDGIPNGKNDRTCVHCHGSKPKKPKLLWAEYEIACKKVGVEPGMIWKIFENGEPMMREKLGRWIPAATDL